MTQKLYLFPSMTLNTPPVTEANKFKARPMKHHRLSYNDKSYFNKIRLIQQFDRPGSNITRNDNDVCFLNHYPSPMLGKINKVGRYNTTNTCEVGEVVTCDPPTNALRRVRNSTIINKQIKSKKQLCKCVSIN